MLAEWEPAMHKGYKILIGILWISWKGCILHNMRICLIPFSRSSVSVVQLLSGIIELIPSLLCERSPGVFLLQAERGGLLTQVPVQCSEKLVSVPDGMRLWPLSILYGLGPLILEISWRCWFTFLQKSGSWEITYICVFFQSRSKVPAYIWELTTVLLIYQILTQNCLFIKQTFWLFIEHRSCRRLNSFACFYRNRKENLFSFQKI